MFLTHDVEAQYTGVGGPLSVFALEAIPQQFTSCRNVPCETHPEQQVVTLSEDASLILNLLTHSKESHSRLNWT